MNSYINIGHFTGANPEQIITPDLAVFHLPVKCPAVNDGVEFGLTMRRILLTQQKSALVDNADFRRINQHKWYAIQNRGLWYAVRNVSEGKKRRHCRMHRFILGAQAGTQIDHINGNGLDNRRENLRFCTASQNQHNQHRIWGRSKYKGVTPNKNKWIAQIRINGKRIHLGLFSTEIEASRAYDDAINKYFGQNK